MLISVKMVKIIVVERVLVSVTKVSDGTFSKMVIMPPLSVVKSPCCKKKSVVVTRVIVSGTIKLIISEAARKINKITLYARSTFEHRFESLRDSLYNSCGLSQGDCGSRIDIEGTLKNRDIKNCLFIVLKIRFGIFTIP